MSEPDLSLPQRMRNAADVMDEAKTRLDVELNRTSEGADSGSDWSSAALRKRADIWEADDRQVSERAQLIDQLAAELTAVTESTFPYNRATARMLVDAGWRKSTDGAAL